jgi:hypothetical protein
MRKAENLPAFFERHANVEILKRLAKSCAPFLAWQKSGGGVLESTILPPAWLLFSADSTFPRLKQLSQRIYGNGNVAQAVVHACAVVA